MRTLDRNGGRLAGEKETLQPAFRGAAERQPAAVEQGQPIGGGENGQRGRKQAAGK